MSREVECRNQRPCSALAGATRSWTQSLLNLQQHGRKEWYEFCFHECVCYSPLASRVI